MSRVNQTKITTNRLIIKKTYKLQTLVLISFIVILFLAPLSSSSQEINYSVQVLPPIASDTINDFDFSKINQEINPQSLKEVKGIATTSNKNYIRVILSKISDFFKGIIKN